MEEQEQEQEQLIEFKVKKDVVKTALNGPDALIVMIPVDRSVVNEALEHADPQEFPGGANLLKFGGRKSRKGSNKRGKKAPRRSSRRKVRGGSGGGSLAFSELSSKPAIVGGKKHKK